VNQQNFNNKYVVNAVIKMIYWYTTFCNQEMPLATTDSELGGVTLPMTNIAVNFSQLCSSTSLPIAAILAEFVFRLEKDKTFSNLYFLIRTSLRTKLD